MILLAQQAINGMMLGAVYVTVAVAFTVTIGILNFLNFTIPALFMVTGMVGWATATRGLPFGLSGPLHWSVALAVGVLASIVCSLIVERYTYRYMKTKFGDATEHAIPLVSSLGFLIVFENLVRIAFGGDAQRFPETVGETSIRVGDLLISLPQLVSLIGALAIVFALSLLLSRTKIGRSLRAIAENPEAATIMGVEVARVVPVLFVLTGALCGLAGAAFVINYGDVSPAMGDEIGSKAIAGMVIGGLGSIWGAIAGGLLVGLTETMAIHWFGADTVQVAVWGLLLVVLLVRPHGLFGHHKIGKGKL